MLNEAQAIDNKYEAGEDIKPLCGMAFVVKDNLDVLGTNVPAIRLAVQTAFMCELLKSSDFISIN